MGMSIRHVPLQQKEMRQEIKTECCRHQIHWKNQQVLNLLVHPSAQMKRDSLNCATSTVLFTSLDQTVLQMHAAWDGSYLSSLSSNCSTGTPKEHHQKSQMTTRHDMIQTLEPLGITFDKPRYPSYAVLTVRISSYQTWPQHMTQTPRDMALAGFLYAGYEDYARCFFCGGGLRNWEAGDDPWVEHARWFPRCAFLRQNKGEEFIALIQEQHLGLVGENEGACGQPNGSQDKKSQSNETEASHSSGLQNIAVEARSLMEENRRLKDQRMCKICLDQEACIAMLPCGHLCCCAECAPAMRKCPICRQFVKGTVKTWLV